ncbi:MAG: glycoside hydrolase family 127 protein, partial [Muribaculaceae bacterium]|nr:glycoside hydrolase family 127 protein [Muribaculaceae bacterium]
MIKTKTLLLSLAMTASLTTQAQSLLYPNEFNLSEVTLLESPFLHARDLNVKTLLAYDVDRLLAPYLKSAGLEPKGESFSNWDGLDGHVGGHYLSALAIHYAATGDKALKDRMDYMLSQLSLIPI